MGLYMASASIVATIRPSDANTGSTPVGSTKNKQEDNMARKTMTYEDNFELTRQAIQAAPNKALASIGKLVRDEVKGKLDKRTGRLKKSVGFWARKKEGDLQIGFYNNYFSGKRWAAFYKEAVTEENNPIETVVKQRKDDIVRLIGEALSKVGTESESYNRRTVEEAKDVQE